VPGFDYAGYARSLGLDGVTVTDPNELGAAWDRALSADRPFVIDAHTDPDVPTLPPHVSPKQAKSYAEALLKGDPHAGGILWQTFKAVTA